MEQGKKKKTIVVIPKEVPVEAPAPREPVKVG